MKTVPLLMATHVLLRYREPVPHVLVQSLHELHRDHLDSEIDVELDRWQNGWNDDGFISTGLNFFSGLIFTTAQVVFIAAKIAFIFTSLPAVQIYDFHIFTVVYSPLHGFIWNQHNDQLPVGWLSQLVEHCTGIAKVMGLNPVQA